MDEADLIGLSFKIEECEICGWFVRCPKCGNNCCNGASGDVDDEPCPVCPTSYAVQEALINKLQEDENKGETS